MCLSQIWVRSGADYTTADDGLRALTLLAESDEGYANLITLSSLGYLRGYYYKLRVDSKLLERRAKGIVALSGCLSARRNGRPPLPRCGRRVRARSYAFSPETR